MKRRDFIALLGGAATFIPLSAWAQQPTMPVVGFLSIASPAPFAHLVAGLRRGLQDAGFVEGRDIAVEYRWAEGRYDRLPELAADLVHRQVAVIVTSGGDNPSLAAKAATTTIPIVFNVGSDPVKVGLVASLARPGGNATGVNIFTSELAEKRFGLLNDAIPAAASFAVLANPNFPPAMADAREVEAAGRRVGKDVAIFHAGSEEEIDSAFARMAQSRPGALLLAGDPFFNGRREQIVALAARHAIPAIYEWREFAEAGGLMSYGTNLVEAYRLQGVYAGRILKGEKPMDLPVVQLSKFDLVINLKTAKALGLSLPPGVLAIADWLASLQNYSQYLIFFAATPVFSEQGMTMPNKARVPTEEEIALYDAIGRAITNVHAALAEIDAAWRRITAERPNPSATAFAALDAADEILAVAREDLGRARTALAGYTQARTQH